jgi:hypothetical protein
LQQSLDSAPHRPMHATDRSFISAHEHIVVQLFLSFFLTDVLHSCSGICMLLVTADN